MLELLEKKLCGFLDKITWDLLPTELKVDSEICEVGRKKFEVITYIYFKTFKNKYKVVKVHTTIGKIINI